MGDDWGEYGDRQPVDVVDERGEKDEANDPPAQSAELETDVGCNCFG